MSLAQFRSRSSRSILGGSSNNCNTKENKMNDESHTSATTMDDSGKSSLNASRRSSMNKARRFRNSNKNLLSYVEEEDVVAPRPALNRRFNNSRRGSMTRSGSMNKGRVIVRSGSCRSLGRSSIDVGSLWDDHSQKGLANPKKTPSPQPASTPRRPSLVASLSFRRKKTQQQQPGPVDLDNEDYSMEEDIVVVDDMAGDEKKNGDGFYLRMKKQEMDESLRVPAAPVETSPVPAKKEAAPFVGMIIGVPDEESPPPLGNYPKAEQSIPLGMTELPDPTATKPRPNVVEDDDETSVGTSYADDSSVGATTVAGDSSVGATTVAGDDDDDSSCDIDVDFEASREIHSKVRNLAALCRQASGKNLLAKVQ